MKHIHTLTVAFALMTALAFTGCEEAQEHLEDAGDSISDAAETAADNTQDAFETAGDHVDDALDNAGDAIDDATN